MTIGPVAKPARALTRWFSANQRDLPWRREIPAGDPGLLLKETAGKESAPRAHRDPYRTWISEIMLQQTQVVTVIDYFHRWMLRFPDVGSLARADESEVLEAWAGLGYYSRARNVLATARKVMDGHGGLFPWRREDLLALKGVGEYTAGAIASLAFGRPEPILDGNLVRVFSRLYGLDFLPDTREGKQAYWDISRSWVEADDPGQVNEGLMELGATVCTPRNPGCKGCPLETHCAARKTDAQEAFPPVRSRKETVDVAGFAVAAFRAGKAGDEVLLYTPRKSERLAGLLTFPVFAVADLAALKAAWRKAVPALAKTTLRPRTVTVSHSITHHRYSLRIVEARIDTGKGEGSLPEGYAWAKSAEVERTLVSSLPRKIWKALG